MTRGLSTAALCGGLEIRVREDLPAGAGDDSWGMLLHGSAGAPMGWLSVHRRPPSAHQIGSAESLQLREVLRHWLAPLPPDARAEVTHFLAVAMGRLGVSIAQCLQSLHGVRQALRERRPPSSQVVVEAVYRVEARHVHVCGIVHQPGTPVELTVVTPEGERVGRGAVGWGPFTICCRLEAPTVGIDGWLVEWMDADAGLFEAAAPPLVGDLLEVSNALTAEWSEVRERAACPPDLRLMQALRRRLRAQTEILVEERYGREPESPRVSRVVPLLGDAADAELHLLGTASRVGGPREEVLYVAGGPNWCGVETRALRELYELYGLPFRLVVPNRTVDHELAVWLGRQRARGRVRVDDVRDDPDRSTIMAALRG